MNALEIITKIKKAGAGQAKVILGVLQDGATLADIGITDADQEAVECAHDAMVALIGADAELTNRLLPAHLAGQVEFEAMVSLDGQTLRGLYYFDKDLVSRTEFLSDLDWEAGPDVVETI